MLSTSITEREMTPRISFAALQIWKKHVPKKMA
jgi:hypothetical protein